MNYIINCLTSDEHGSDAFAVRLAVIFAAWFVLMVAIFSLAGGVE